MRALFPMLDKLKNYCLGGVVVIAGYGAKPQTSQVRTLLINENLQSCIFILSPISYLYCCENKALSMDY